MSNHPNHAAPRRPWPLSRRPSKAARIAELEMAVDCLMARDADHEKDLEGLGAAITLLTYSVYGPPSKASRQRKASLTVLPGGAR